MTLVEQFKAGFSFYEGYKTQEILLDKERTTDKVLAFNAYDANMYPLPDVTRWKPELRNKTISLLLNGVKGVNIEVWLDSMKIKDGHTSEDKND